MARRLSVWVEGETHVKAFHELGERPLTPAMLQNEMQSRGYLLLRNVLPQDAVRSVLADVTRVLFAADWLAAGPEALKRIPAHGAAYGDPDPAFKRVYQQVFNLESFHALPHHAELKHVMKLLVGDPVLVHPKPIGRLIFPSCERLTVNAHQDYEFMGGDPEFFTVWIPLHDCPVDVGPLRIFEGSHRHGVQQHQKENLHVPEIPTGEEKGNEWVGGSMNAGDVLIFHSLTVHAASQNVSKQMRLSIDCRFQNAERVLNPSNLVFGGESGKSWEKTYSGWKSNALQFYWKSMPLTLQPSREELEHLSQTAETPASRDRYARMVGQLT
jgi:ectoine hydroxylase-related dioxygenase (phytanoyl-CoA dioxygenase family)